MYAVFIFAFSHPSRSLSFILSLHLYASIISSLLSNRSTEFYCDGYKIKANTNTSSNVKRQRYKTDVKIAGISSFGLFMHEYISWLVCKFDWLLASPTNAHTRTHTHYNFYGKYQNMQNKHCVLVEAFSLFIFYYK